MNTSSSYKFPYRLDVELTPEQATESNISTVVERAIECIDKAVDECGFLIIYCHSYNVTTATYTLLEDVLVPILEHLQPLIEKGQCLVGNTSELMEYYFSKRWGEQ